MVATTVNADANCHLLKPLDECVRECRDQNGVLFATFVEPDNLTSRSMWIITESAHRRKLPSVPDRFAQSAES